MQGGINNAALFNASQREARGKLEQMAGIKRPPSGILASSPELMNAVGSAAAPAMPVRATGPATPVTPAPVQQAQVALPQVPAPMTVAPGPVQQTPAPAPAVPTVPQPASPTTPMKFNEAGPVDVGKAPTVSDPLSALQYFGNSLGNDFLVPFINRYGSPEEAEKAGVQKVDLVSSTLDATDDPKQVSDAVMVAAEIKPTAESKKEFASTVLNLDTDDIGEIDDAIFRTLTADVTLSGKELQKAVLLGLQNYKQTASARAAAKSGGSGMSPLEPFPDAVRDLAGKIMTATGEDPAVAIQQARDALAPYYTGQAGPTTTTETTETATVTIEQHKSANDAAKQAGQKTYTLGGQEFQVQ
jgi:hypothetical protein